MGVGVANRKKFDLSNPGGQPKSWLDGDNSDAPLISDAWIVIQFVGVIALLFASVGGVLFGLLKLTGKL